MDPVTTRTIDVKQHASDMVAASSGWRTRPELSTSGRCFRWRVSEGGHGSRRGAGSGDFTTGLRVDIAGNAAPAAPEASLVAATRALLRVASAADVRDIATRLVEDLGAEVVLAESDDGSAVPIDISFGAGPPLLPAAAAASVERMLVERHLPLFVEDAHRALTLVLHADRLAEDAAIDPLTRLANRRASGRVLGRLRDRDVLALIDLDHFKVVNDTLGHDEGDRVLRAFGQLLHDGLRAGDHAGRRGGEEFLVVLPDTGLEATTALLGRLRTTWAEARPHPVGFSVGVAIGGHGGRALAAADRALYRAKAAGRGRTEVALPEDYS